MAMTGAQHDLINDLQQALKQGAIKPGSTTFAMSLLSQAKAKNSLSEKQWACVQDLVGLPVLGGDPKPVETKKPTALLGDPIKLYTMMHAAKGHGIAYPIITLRAQLQKGYEDLTFTMAGKSALHPGTINVVHTVTENWLGRIHPDGVMEISKHMDGWSAEPQLLTWLQDFLTHPETALVVSGTLTKKCALCNTPLAGPDKQTKVGSVCAASWGLAPKAKAKPISWLDVPKGDPALNTILTLLDLETPNKGMLMEVLKSRDNPVVKGLKAKLLAQERQKLVAVIARKPAPVVMETGRTLALLEGLV